MFISAWSRSVLAKTATLSGIRNVMIQFVSLCPMGRSTSVVFGVVPCRRIVR